MKTALVTGASRGIGRATALAFARAGYAVAVQYHTRREGAEETVRACLAAGADAFCLPADLADGAQAQALIKQATARAGHIDVLVNNAGVAHRGLFTAADAAESWRQVLAVNLDGAAACCRAVLPQMIARHSGAIVNVSSIWGVTGASCEVAYSASKAGLIGLTRALAAEVGPSGVTVNCVAPGVIDTEMNASLGADTLRELAGQTPLGRLGTPEEVAQAILFLAQASFITGQTLSVDGGFLL